VIQALQAAIVLWLPGAVLFRVPWLDRDRRASLDAEERLFWAVVLSVAVSLSFVILLAAFNRYSFPRLVMADAGLAAALAAASRLRLRLGAAARWPRLAALVPLALVALGAWLFFPPAEYIIGGKDPGTYVNEGIQIAQRGSLVVRDPVIAEVPAFARDLFFPQHTGSAEYGLRFMGFFILDPDTGQVVGQFPHLFPASIAIGYGLYGLTGALATSGAWAILGLLAVYFAAARLAGRTAAAAAAALLALNVIEVWFGRYPNAEMVMQALLFAALLANARTHVDDDPFFAPVAGVLLALLLFLRFDAVLAIAGVFGGLLLSTLCGRRPRLSFLAAFAAVASLAVVYLVVVMPTYMQLPFAYFRNLRWWHYGLLVLAAAVFGLALAAAARNPALRNRMRAHAPLALALALVAAAVYAYYFRHAGGRLAEHDAAALRTFTNDYVTLPVVAAALLGYVLMARRAFWRDPAMFTTIAVFATFVFFKIRIVPEQFWLARRFIPLILPGALLFAAAAALGGPRGTRGAVRAARLAIGVVFVALVGAQYARASRPVARHHEYADLVPGIERLAGLMGDRDLVIAESRNAGGDMHVLAAPLAYIYARSVLVLNSPRPDKPAFAAFLEWARTRYDRVLFLGGSGSDVLSYRYGVRALTSDRFQVPEYDAPKNAYPRGVRRKEFDFGLYEFTDAPRTPAPWFDLDVGRNDDLHVLRFHAKETTEGRSFRWTRATSYVAVTTVPPDAREVMLEMSDGGRPPGAPPADLVVYLQGEPLGTIHVTHGFRRYMLAIPAGLAARAAAYRDPVELRLVTALWNPHEVIGGPDDRDLGVMLDRVTVR
jgi:hypothetical protein